MKLKYYLRGLGIGILVSTILLMIAFSGHKNDVSDEEIITRAKQLGMVMQEEQGDEEIPKGTEEESEPDTTAADATETGARPGTATTDPETETTDSETETGKDAENTEGNPENVGELIEFTVKKGVYSIDVAMELHEDGLVDNPDAFNEYMVANGYDNLIMIGTVQIPKGASYEEICKILTEKK